MPNAYYPQYFEGINLDALNDSGNSWLADKIKKYQAGQGKLGLKYQSVLGGLGRALNYKGPHSENDIRNSGLSIGNQGAASWFGEKNDLQSMGAATGLMDSGGFGKAVAQRGAEAANATNAAVLGDYSSRIAENEAAKLDRLNSATEAMNNWLALRRKQRMSEAEKQAMLESQGGGGNNWADILGTGFSIGSMFV